MNEAATPLRPVTFGDTKGEPGGRLVRLALDAASSSTTVDGALALAVRLSGALVDAPTIDYRDLWQALATLAAHDVGASRVIEPSVDATLILREAGRASLLGDCTWGVFAAEGGDDPLRASLENYGTWRLAGTKPWCSLASRLSCALFTAQLDDGSRGLFAVDLQGPGIDVAADAWKARGLAEIPSGPVHLDAVSGIAVGEPGWYLSRPGFAWGGIGVAACWYGGAVGVARHVYQKAQEQPGIHLSVHLGAIDEVLQAAGQSLLRASELEPESLEPTAASLVARRARGIVVRACEEVLWRAGHALGPAPLALDEGFAKRTADLALYIRQHHAERDQASLGEALVRDGVAPW